MGKAGRGPTLKRKPTVSGKSRRLPAPQRKKRPKPTVIPTEVYLGKKPKAPKRPVERKNKPSKMTYKRGKNPGAYARVGRPR